MPSKRDVSPIGSSKYERPFTAPSTKSTRTTPATSPTDGAFPTNLPFTRHPVRESGTSTIATYSTAPTSIDGAVERPMSDVEFRKLAGPGERYLAPPVAEDEYIDEEEAYDDEETYGDEANGYHEQRDSGVDSSSGRGKSETDSAFPTKSQKCPDAATLAAVQDFPIYDAEGRETKFGLLFHPETASTHRQLIIFLRWAFCPSCTGFLTALTQGISPEEHANLTPPTSITIINCGQPDLLPHYKNWTSCPWPMYSASQALYQRLGMRKSMSVGKVPDYTTKGLIGQSKDELNIVSQSLKDPDGIRKRDFLRGGHPMQVGGEFLFENGRAVWCHRMKDYRGHAKIADLRRVVGLEG